MRVVLLLSVVLCSLLTTEMLMYSRNSLFQHPEWVVGKSLVTSALMGWLDTMTHRNLLAGNQLNLDCWHGYQELLWHEPVKLGRLRCRIQLKEDARLHIQLERTATGGTGFHLSRHPRFESLAYTFDRDGEYLKKSVIPLELGSGWYQIELSRTPERWILRLDGKEISSGIDALGGAGLVCFRGGFHPSRVDDVLLEDTDGRVVCREGFRNSSNFFAVWAGVITLLALPTLAFLRASRRTQRRWTLTMLGSSMLVFGLWQLDFHYWSHRYHYYGVIPGGWGMKENPVETARIRLANSINVLDPDQAPRSPSLKVRAFLKTDPAVDDNDSLKVITPDGELLRFNDDLPSCADLRQRIQPGDRMVMILGTSQAWGAGANRQQDRIQWRLHSALGAERLWLVNASKSGSNSTELLERYRSHLMSLSPDLLVIWLSANDSRRPNFRENLEAFLARNETSMTETLLIKEPLALDSFFNDRGHREMDEVVEKTGTPSFDLHARLQDHVNDGILYWDFVHLTSFGQRLVSQLVADEIARQGLLARGSVSSR